MLSLCCRTGCLGLSWPQEMALVSAQVTAGLLWTCAAQTACTNQTAAPPCQGRLQARHCRARWAALTDEERVVRTAAYPRGQAALQCLMAACRWVWAGLLDRHCCPIMLTLLLQRWLQYHALGRSRAILRVMAGLQVARVLGREA